MKPILFNTEMVKAILDGRKTVTRRVVKTKHKDACGFYVTTRKSDGAFMGVYEYDENEGTWDNPLKPPYEVNDILYVRETWSDHYEPNEEGKPELQYCYKADGIDIKAECLPGENNRWYPSIHMPKAAARIFLKVTGAHAERLCEITEEQAQAEGCNSGLLTGECTARGQFENLWNSTIKKDQLQYYGWNANPYVWVIEFEVIDKAVALKEA